jgi:hypothetical protein
MYSALLGVYINPPSHKLLPPPSPCLLPPPPIPCLLLPLVGTPTVWIGGLGGLPVSPPGGMKHHSFFVKKGHFGIRNNVTATLDE